MAQAAARLRGTRIPGRGHPPILCQQQAERSSPACGRAAGWRAAGLRLCFPIRSPPLLPPAPPPSPSRSRHSLSSHDVIRWKSAMLEDWNNPALTRGPRRRREAAAAEPLGAPRSCSQGQGRDSGIRGGCVRAGWAWWGRSPGRQVRSRSRCCKDSRLGVYTESRCSGYDESFLGFPAALAPRYGDGHLCRSQEND